MWTERRPTEGETVKFDLNGHATIGIFLRRGAGSAQSYWIVDIGSRRVWLWGLTTFEVWNKKTK